MHSGPSSFDFDQPHAADLLSDFAPVTPAEVTRLLHSMSNKSSQLDCIPTSLLKSCADRYFLPPHLPSCKPIILPANFFYQFQTCAHLTPFEKNLVCQNLILPISGPFLISIQLATFWSDLLLHDFFPMCRSLPVSVLFSLLTASSTQLKLPCSSLQTTSSKT